MSLTAAWARWSQDRQPDLPDDVFLDPVVPFEPVGAPGADGVLTAVPALMGLFLTIFVVVVVVKLVQGARTVAANSAQPERSVTARVVGRRMRTEGGGNDTAVRSVYFATFELPDGERLELKVPARQYGQVAEGDEGQLTHQGTWFRGFERRRVIPVDGTWEAPGGPSLPPPPRA